MPYDIKCHKVWQYGYQKNRIDQTNWSMGHWALRIEKNEAKNAKNLNVNFSYVFSFVISKGKIAKEDAIFEKSLFCEKFLEYDFTWKKCWFQIEIQSFILTTRPTEQCHTQIFYPGWAVLHSDFLAWLSSATFRFISLAEQCHTQIL